MRSRRKIFEASYLALTCVVLVGTASEATSSDLRKVEKSKTQIIQGRNLILYDDGGEFSNVLLDGNQIRPSADALRTFIWNHWTQKKRGYVRFATSGIDNRNISHIFIEPTPAGGWHIAWRRVNQQAFIPPPPDTLSVELEIVAVEQARRKKDDFWEGDPVLVFRAKDGKEIYRL